MRLVSVTRILNEDDIVEAFVRHHAALVDVLVFLDDGSTDETLTILKSLKDEGFPVQVIQSKSVVFDETSRNTWLFHYAVQALQADWVLFLDTDEFIDEGRSARPLRELLAATAPDVWCVSVRLINYVDTARDDVDELVVPRRLRWRLAEPLDVHKVFVRAGDGTRRAIVDAGNHQAFQDGVRIDAAAEEGVRLAHYPRRSGWHDISKSVIGWLKVLAAGQSELSQNRSIHYKGVFDILRDRPTELLNNKSYFEIPPETRGLINDPIAYRGGELRYTSRSDYKGRCVTQILRYAEELAASYGLLVDEAPAVRSIVNSRSDERTLLF